MVKKKASARKKTANITKAMEDYKSKNAEIGVAIDIMRLSQTAQDVRTSPLLRRLAYRYTLA